MTLKICSIEQKVYVSTWQKIIILAFLRNAKESNAPRTLSHKLIYRNIQIIFIPEGDTMLNDDSNKDDSFKKKLQKYLIVLGPFLVIAILCFFEMNKH